MDQTDKEAIKALTEQIRYDEAYMAAMATSMDGMAKTIVDLSNRSQTLEHEWSRWNKWTSDNAVRLMQLEGRINEETNKERAFTIETFKAIDDYLDEKKLEERINRIDEMVAGHNFYMDHLYQVKPAEGYTIKSGFEAVAQQVLQLRQSVAQNEQILAQMSAGAAQTETAFVQISIFMEENRKEIQKHFDDVRSEVSVKIGEVQAKMDNIKAEYDSWSPPTAYPPGWEYPARSPAYRAPQFC